MKSIKRAAWFWTGVGGVGAAIGLVVTAMLLLLEKFAFGDGGGWRIWLFRGTAAWMFAAAVSLAGLAVGCCKSNHSAALSFGCLRREVFWSFQCAKLALPALYGLISAAGFCLAGTEGEGGLGFGFLWLMGLAWTAGSLSLGELCLSLYCVLGGKAIPLISVIFGVLGSFMGMTVAMAEGGSLKANPMFGIPWVRTAVLAAGVCLFLAGALASRRTLYKLDVKL